MHKKHLVISKETRQHTLLGDLPSAVLAAGHHKAIMKPRIKGLIAQVSTLKVSACTGIACIKLLSLSCAVEDGRTGIVKHYSLTDLSKKGWVVHPDTINAVLDCMEKANAFAINLCVHTSVPGIVILIIPAQLHHCCLGHGSQNPSPTVPGVGAGGTPWAAPVR